MILKIAQYSIFRYIVVSSTYLYRQAWSFSVAAETEAMGVPVLHNIVFLLLRVTPDGGEFIILHLLYDGLNRHFLQGLIYIGSVNGRFDFLVAFAGPAETGDKTTGMLQGLRRQCRLVPPMAQPGEG
jgi:hypothetical protein